MFTSNRRRRRLLVATAALFGLALIAAPPATAGTLYHEQYRPQLYPGRELDERCRRGS